MIVTRSALIISDTVLVGTLVAINYGNDGGFIKAPVILKFLVIVAFATCIVRHINYYKVHKRIY
jgi:hypothetical protein